jgi:protein-disulfide isomerase
MICLLALIVFSILGIFSVRYRKLAIEAIGCVFHRMTLRPCQSGMDKKLRSNLVAAISKKNVKLAKFVVKRFEVISWFFTVLMILSIFFSLQGLYFYVLYGNCNGLGSNEFCVFDVLNPKDDSSSCSDPSMINNDIEIVYPTVDDELIIGPNDAKVTIIEFGCYSCPYTRTAEPVVKEILQEYEDKIKYAYRDFPLPTHDNADLAANAAQCAKEQNNFWEYHNLIFAEEFENINNNTLIDLSSSLDMNEEQFSECLNTKKYNDDVQKDFNDGQLAGVYGTPTFFINDEIIVGPKPFRYFKNIIDKELKK